jgi:hypothetical protein
MFMPNMTLGAGNMTLPTPVNGTLPSPPTMANGTIVAPGMINGTHIGPGPVNGTAMINGTMTNATIVNGTMLLPMPANGTAPAGVCGIPLPVANGTAPSPLTGANGTTLPSPPSGSMSAPALPSASATVKA